MTTDHRNESLRRRSFETRSLEAASFDGADLRGAALLRLGQQGARLTTSDGDRRLASAFVDDVEAVRADGASSAGRAW